MAETAGQQPRPVIIVDCPADTLYGLPFCQALIQPIAEQAPRHIVRLGAADIGLNANDLRVTVTLSQVYGYNIEGHTRWQSGAGQVGIESHPIRAESLDAKLSPDVLSAFARALIIANPPPL